MVSVTVPVSVLEAAKLDTAIKTQAMIEKRHVDLNIMISPRSLKELTSKTCQRRTLDRSTVINTNKL